MNERIRRLRQQSLEARPALSAERAHLITQFYASDEPARHSVPVARALALRYVLEHRRICILPDELIVGERGPAPKATPTYPELCCHSQEDLRVLDGRERTPFAVDKKTRSLYAAQIIPFWRGKTQRERVFGHMTEPWHAAFDAGVFTEFMEQRAPGHAILDDTIYRYGLLDLKAEIATRRAQLDGLHDPRAYDKAQEYEAMTVAIDAVVHFAKRHAHLARELAETETDPQRREELEGIAAVCTQVPAQAPRTFHEALQAYWFVHLGVITELNTWDSLNPGRLDQHLWPFYQEGLAAGTLTEDRARELLGCFWVKFNNQPAPPKVGVTEEQSGTYQDFCLINLGGVDPRTGGDAVNDLSYLILDVVREMRLIQPSACVQIARVNPDRFLRRACEVIRTGFGQPSVFNTDVILQEMLHDGKSLVDARSGGPSGCVTISAFGKESTTLTGYLNWAKILELTLHNGRDPRSGRQLGPKTGDPRGFATYADLFAAYREQLAHFVDLKIAGNHVIERLFATVLPAPFMSVLMADCIARGVDIHAGGARYNPTYIQGVGIATVTDALAAIRHHVYERASVTWDALLAALAADFTAEHEALGRTLEHDSPRYGNDDPAADSIVREVFEAYYDVLNGRPNTKGGRYRVNLLPTTVHVYFGSAVGALPNGRRAGQPVSDGISPSHGADTQGPTAVLKSAACIDHARTGGTLLNMKFPPQILADEAGIEKLSHLIRTYFRMNGHHIQFNVVDAETLRRAQAEPAAHRDLIVRVAGYSDYFVDIGRDLQDEIIARTEQCAL